MAGLNPIKYADFFEADSTFSDLIEQIDLVVKTYVDGGKKISSEARRIQSALKNASSETKQGQKEIRDAAKDVDLLIEKQKEQAEQFESNIEALTKSTGDYVSTIDDFRKKTDQLLANDNFEQYVTKNRDGITQYKRAIEETQIAQQRIFETQQDWKELLDSGKVSIDEYAEVTQRLTDTDNKLEQSLQSLVAANKEVQQSIKEDDAISKYHQNFAALSETVQKTIIRITELRAEQNKNKAVVKEINDLYKAGNITYAEYIDRLASVNGSIEQNRIAINQQNAELKNQINFADSVADSYNNLSAQYSINKTRLNEMSAAEREGTEYGRQLEEETAAIYAEMDRLQQATGKFTLQVGNYAEGGKALVSIIRDNTYELARLRMEGEQNSETYRNLINETAEYQNSLRLSQRELRALSSETLGVDAVMSATTASGGAFALYSGLAETAGANAETLAQSQVVLQKSIAITSGIMAINNGLIKNKSLLTLAARVQQVALNKATDLNTAAQSKNIIVSKSAIITQRALNAVANANPYLLLFAALTTVIGGLVAWTSIAGSAERTQARQNEQTRVYLEQLQTINGLIEENADRNITALQNQIKILKSQGAALSEIYAIEDEIALRRQDSYEQQAKNAQQQIADISANEAKLRDLTTQLHNFQTELAAGRGYKNSFSAWLFGGVNVNKEIEKIQKEIDNTQTSLKIAYELENTGNQNEADVAAQARERLDQYRAIAARELQILRSAGDTRIALLDQNYETQRRRTQIQYDRQIEDLKIQLQTEEQLTTKSRAAIYAQIEDLQKLNRKEQDRITREQYQAELQLARQYNDSLIAVMKDGADKQRIQLETQYARDIEDIRYRLQYEENLTAAMRENLRLIIINKERQLARELEQLGIESELARLQAANNGMQLRLAALQEGSAEELDLRLQIIENERRQEIAANNLLVEELRQSEEQINAKYDAIRLRANRDSAIQSLNLQQEQYETEISALNYSERKKTDLILKYTVERLRQQLAVLRSSNASQAEIDLVEAQIQEALTKITNNRRPQDIWDVLGIDFGENGDGKKQAINEAVNFTISQINAIADARVQAADRMVAAAERTLDSARNELDTQIRLAELGYAHDIELAQKELEQAKKNQEAALREQEKALKAQEKLKAAEQTINLISASALIWSQLGFPFAIAAIAAMWGSFAAAKIKAREATKVEYASGGTDIFGGGSHASGNDTVFMSRNGVEHRAERGERWAIFSKKATRANGSALSTMINGINSGDIQLHGNAYKNIDNPYVVDRGTINLNKLEKGVNYLVKQGESTEYSDGRRTIKRHKNLRTIIRN